MKVEKKTDYDKLNDLERATLPHCLHLGLFWPRWDLGWTEDDGEDRPRVPTFAVELLLGTVAITAKTTPTFCSSFQNKSWFKIRRSRRKIRL
jgi:hypothetical protein